MKKLKLDDLRVESFATTPGDEAARAAVFAHQQQTVPQQTVCGGCATTVGEPLSACDSCNYCRNTGVTCDSCQSCVDSCANTCPITCGYASKCVGECGGGQIPSGNGWCP